MGTLCRDGRATSRLFLPVLFVGILTLTMLVPCELRAQTAKTPSSGTSQAILIKGSDPVKGLPGFGRNALPALYGEYATRMAGEDLSLRVWATREALYLKAGVWTARRSGPYTFRETKAPGNDDELPTGTAFLLTLVERPFPAGGLGALPEEWSLVFAFPEQTTPDAARTAALDRFRRSLLDRFSYFLSQARLPTDVSFPANLEY